jgi:hypothetical protein
MALSSVPRLDAGGHLILVHELLGAQAGEQVPPVGARLGSDVSDGLVGPGDNPVEMASR